MVLPLTLTASALGALNDAREGVADPTNDGLQARINRGLCDIWASNPNAASLALGFAGTAVANELCGKYWKDDGFDPPQEVPPFVGGQCEGVIYNLRGTGELANGVVVEIGGSAQLAGKITSISSIPSTADPAFVGGFRYGNSAGSFVNKFFGSNPSTRVVPETAVPILTRADGQPDNCGDPDGELQPIPDYPRQRDFDTPTDIGTPESPDLWVYSPTVDIKGSPYIRVKPATGNPGVGLPTVAIPGGFSDPSFPPEETPPPIEGEPEDIPTGGAGGETGEPTPPDTPPDQKAVCVGYAWELSGFPDGDSIIVGSDRILPYVAGNLQLILKLDEQKVLRSDNLELSVNRGTLITPYEGLSVAGARWTKRQDLALRLTPLYKIVAQEIAEV